MIITIYVTCFNQADKISLLLSDLEKQSDTRFKVVVVDANSNDNTLCILKDYEKKLNLKFISEKDDGIYYGLNKAISLIDSGHCICLGADDRVLNEDFIFVLNKKVMDLSVLYYTDLFINNGKYSRLKEYPIPAIFKKMYGGLAHLHHQTALIPHWFLKEKMYNTSYSTFSDLDLLFKAQKKLTLHKLSVNGVYFSSVGTSGSLKNIIKKILEISLIRHRNGLSAINLRVLGSFLRQILRF